MSIFSGSAEFTQVTTAPTSSLVTLQVFDSNLGQYVSKNITVSNFLVGTTQTVQVNLSPITALAGANIVLFSAPFAGTINSIRATISGAITSSSIVITPSVYVAASGTAVTNGVVTIPTAASGIGTTVVATPTAANTFAAGSSIIATVTGGVGTVNGVITLSITRTA